MDQPTTRPGSPSSSSNKGPKITIGVEIEVLLVYETKVAEKHYPQARKHTNKSTDRDSDTASDSSSSSGSSSSSDSSFSPMHMVTQVLKEAGVNVYPQKNKPLIELDPPEYSRWTVDEDTSVFFDGGNEGFDIAPALKQTHEYFGLEIISPKFSYDDDAWRDEISSVLSIMQDTFNDPRKGDSYRLYSPRSSGLHIHVGIGTKEVSERYPLETVKSVLMLTTAFERVVDELHATNRFDGSAIFSRPSSQRFVDDTTDEKRAFYRAPKPAMETGGFQPSWSATHAPIELGGLPSKTTEMYSVWSGTDDTAAGLGTMVEEAQKQAMDARTFATAEKLFEDPDFVDAMANVLDNPYVAGRTGYAQFFAAVVINTVLQTMDVRDGVWVPDLDHKFWADALSREDEVGFWLRKEYIMLTGIRFLKQFLPDHEVYKEHDDAVYNPSKLLREIIRKDNQEKRHPPSSTATRDFPDPTEPRPTFTEAAGKTVVDWCKYMDTILQSYANLCHHTSLFEFKFNAYNLCHISQAVWFGRLGNRPATEDSDNDNDLPALSADDGERTPTDKASADKASAAQDDSRSNDSSDLDFGDFAEEYSDTELDEYDGKRTIEFRQHRSTLDAAEIIAWMEVVAQMIRFSHMLGQSGGMMQLIEERAYSPSLDGLDFLRLIGVADETVEYYRGWLRIYDLGDWVKLDRAQSEADEALRREPQDSRMLRLSANIARARLERKSRPHVMNSIKTNLVYGRYGVPAEHVEALVQTKYAKYGILKRPRMFSASGTG